MPLWSYREQEVSSLNAVNQRSWKHRVALMTIRKNFLKQLLMFWKIQAYFKELMFEHRLARGCERSVQLRANKRGFFKIAPHILENHRLLLRSCFLNAVNQRSWKHRVALMTIRKNFLKQLLMFWKIQAYFKELMFEHRLAKGCERND